MIRAYVIGTEDNTGAEKRYSAGAVYELNGQIVFSNAVTRFDREGLGKSGAGICGAIMAIQDCFNLQQFTGDDNVIISVYDEDVVALGEGGDPENDFEGILLEYILEMSEKMTLSFEMPYQGQEDQMNKALDLAKQALKEPSYERSVRSAV